MDGVLQTAMKGCSNPHEEIKHTGKANYIGKYKRKYKYTFCNFFLSDLKDN